MTIFPVLSDYPKIWRTRLQVHIMGRSQRKRWIHWLGVGFIALAATLGWGFGTSLSAVQANAPTLDLKSHPLPSTLQDWAPNGDRDDYFDQIQTHPLGYLLWTDFPVTVYVGESEFTDETRSQAWDRSVEEAIAQWQEYFPLTITSLSDKADISIEQTRPKINPQGRARSAQATPKVFCVGDRLQHRFKIEISPSQTGPYIQAAARHELGHALGLWGHSQNSNDVLYFSQVSNPPHLSLRDINTLKKVYEQPTLLGWRSPYCESNSSSSSQTP